MTKGPVETPTLPTPKGWLRPDVLCASVAINIFGLAVPLVVLQTYDRLIPNQSTDTLMALVVALCVVVLLDAGLRVCRAMLLGWCGVRFEHKQYLRALEHLLHADLASFENESKGSYLDQFQGLEQVREYYHGQTMMLLVDLPFVVLFLWLIWSFAGPLVLVPLTVIAVFTLASMVAARFLRDALNARTRNYDHRQNFIIECLQGIHTLKSMAMEPQMQRRYERLQGQSAEALYSLAQVNAGVQALGVGFSQAVMFSFIGLGAWSAVHGTLSIGALAAGTMLAGRVLQPSLKAMGMWTQLQGVKLARKRFNDLLAMPSEAVDDGGTALKLEGEIELVDVHFARPDSDQEILKGINLHIAPGEAIGITGANGSGKTTLLDLIMGFDAPTSGQVLFDGMDITSLDRSSMRAQIGLVPQRGVLFSGTLLENMTLFREGRATDDALELVERLGMQETITRLPNGLNTVVGETGGNALSEGFRQRVIMVRALVGEQQIVLFDDANTSFDHNHDEHLLHLLNDMRGHMTLIIVSHRPSLLKLCDRCFKLDEGTLSHHETGPATIPIPVQPPVATLARAGGM